MTSRRKRNGSSLGTSTAGEALAAEGDVSPKEEQLPTCENDLDGKRENTIGDR